MFGEDYDIPLDSEIDYGGRLGPIERLEHEIQRRLDRKNMRKSPVTLFELIIELKNLEKEERRRRRLTDTPDDLLIYADDVVSIAHDEGYQESSMVRLAEYLEGLEIEEEMTLAESASGWSGGSPRCISRSCSLRLTAGATSVRRSSSGTFTCGSAELNRWRHPLYPNRHDTYSVTGSYMGRFMCRFSGRESGGSLSRRVFLPKIDIHESQPL